jgi:hypothetical protein
MGNTPDTASGRTAFATLFEKRCNFTRPGCQSFTPEYLVRILMPSGKEDILQACGNCLTYLLKHESGRVIEWCPW